MHIPHKDGLRLLVRHEPMTDADWFTLLETRAALLKPHLHNLALKPLGDVNSLRIHVMTESPYEKSEEAHSMAPDF